jgi:glutamyl-tRNA synthetase
MTAPMTAPVVTRFAPSPTGYLHIGGARTALFNWAFARHHGGKMVLRIEDTDRARSTEPAVQAIRDGLSWLGLDWDGNAVSQFEQAGRHRQVAEDLVQAGKAYFCYTSPAELTAMREKARAEGRPPRYDGTWRNRNAVDAPAGVRPVVRIKAPQAGAIELDDHVRGQVRFEAGALDDFIILRSDGAPTYMLAVVVDDHDMGVTHIIRGDDHFTNAARQQVIYDALGWTMPQIAHLPLILGPDGAKLSKRHGALGVEAYRDMGYLPAALRNYLARLGWAHGDDEIFSDEEFVAWFSLAGINKSAARFDFDKLASINGHYIRTSAPADLAEAMIATAGQTGREEDANGLLEKRNSVIAGLPVMQPRAKTVLELIDLAGFLYATRPLPLDERAAKALNEEGRRLVVRALAALETLTDWSGPAIETCLRELAEAEGVKLGKVAQPLRAALTGRAISPGIFDVLGLLGAEEALARLGDIAPPGDG